MNLFLKSIEIIKENQSKSGAYIASPNLRVYRYSWFRDGSWIAYAMLISGNTSSAEKFHDWASRVIIKNENKIILAIKSFEKGKSLGENFIHARYTVRGEEINENWGEFQLDGLGVWLWSVSQFIRYTGKEKKEWIKSANLICNYLKKLWNIPCYDLWEENPEKVHTSTLASIYGGLFLFSEFFPDKNLNETCKNIKEFILKNNVYEDKLVKYVGSKEVDASLILCTIPFNLFSINEDIIEKTVLQIVKDLKGIGGLRRYKGDVFYGGGEWILLGCLLGLYYFKKKKINEAKNIIKWVENHADKNFYLPEQINPKDKKKYGEWVKLWGNPANPLLWSHAMYIILYKKFSELKNY